MTKILSEEERRMWEADEPTLDFASRTLERMMRESQAEGEGLERVANVRAASFTRKGVLAPLLLVAIFFSFGAAAALGKFGSGPSLVSSEAGTKGDSFSAPPRQVKVGIPASTAHAEREPEAPEHPKLPRARVGKTNAQKADDTDSAQTTQEQPAKRGAQPLHFPQCECGTSGIVCSCAD